RAISRRADVLSAISKARASARQRRRSWSRLTFGSSIGRPEVPALANSGSFRPTVSQPPAAGTAPGSDGQPMRVRSLWKSSRKRAVAEATRVEDAACDEPAGRALHAGALAPVAAAAAQQADGGVEFGLHPHAAIQAQEPGTGRPSITLLGLPGSEGLVEAPLA